MESGQHWRLATTLPATPSSGQVPDPPSTNHVRKCGGRPSFSCDYRHSLSVSKFLRNKNIFLRKKKLFLTNKISFSILKFILYRFRSSPSDGKHGHPHDHHGHFLNSLFSSSSRWFWFFTALPADDHQCALLQNARTLTLVNGLPNPNSRPEQQNSAIWS